MPDQPTIRIFISSPADVRPERLKAEQIVRRLDREFAYHFHVEPLLWEREPLVATRHFQDSENIPPPHGCDIVIVILWSRLGVPLPADKFHGAVSGRSPVTGTEWEFEDALASARARGAPDLLLYRKEAEPEGRGTREALLERAAQLNLVEEFVARWFRNAGDQSLSAASHPFVDTAAFEEQLYEHLHALLARRAGGGAADGVIRWHEPPFRALQSYDYEHAPVFFGRTHARNELRELLARQIERGSAFVLVFGASGSGKSSLVKAGLLPDLALPGMIGRIGLLRRAVMRPSDGPGDPLDALAAAILSPTALPELQGLHYTPERLAALLRKAPEEAVVPMLQGLTAAGRATGLVETAEARLAIIVDQLEEIFTIDELGDDRRTDFVAALAALSKSGIVLIVATMRSDFFDKLETLPALAALSEDGRFLLLPPDEAEVGQIIRQPAQEAGLRFERDLARGVDLADTIRLTQMGDRGALPLLSFLLDQLWQRRTEAGLLTFAAYNELGGLEGAIGRRAEEVFLAQPEAIQRELSPLLRALVTMRGTLATARPAPLASFPTGSPRRILVDALRHPQARLLVNFGPVAEQPGAVWRRADGPELKSSAQVRLAHEALLTHWPRAKQTIETDARDLDLRDRLEEAAERWQAAPTPHEKRGRMIAGLALAEARSLRARWGSELPMLVRDYIAASRHAAWWRVVRLAGMASAAAVGLPMLVLLAWAAIVWSGVRHIEAEWAAKGVFVAIPAGCFQMGSPTTEAGRQNYESPMHQVCVKAFELGRFDVTQSEWRGVMIYPFNSKPAYSKGDLRPIEEVSWNDIQWFIGLMSWFGGATYRLPTEAEWEYAARAGTTTPYFWGVRPQDGCAYAKMADAAMKQYVAGALDVDCHYKTSFGTEPVGSFKPNPWGLYDMLGNVSQWVEDCFATSYAHTPTDGTALDVPRCGARVLRGGSWVNVPLDLRAATRAYAPPDTRSGSNGFRVIRTP